MACVSDRRCPSVCLPSSLREEVARFLSFYCKSPAPLQAENVSSPSSALPRPSALVPQLLAGQRGGGLRSAFHSVLICF